MSAVSGSRSIFHRIATAAQFTSGNPTLGLHEFGFESDTGLYKIGTGTTAWTSLAYAGAAHTGDLAVSGKFGANGVAAQGKATVSAAVVTTGAGLASYGYTQAQADAIVTLLNQIRAALVANGIAV